MFGDDYMLADEEWCDKWREREEAREEAEEDFDNAEIFGPDDAPEGSFGCECCGYCGTMLDEMGECPANYDDPMEDLDG